MPSADPGRHPPSRGRRCPSWLVDASLVTLAALVPTAIECSRGLLPAASDLGLMFIPNWSWWFETSRWTGGWNPWTFGGHPANGDPLTSRFHPLAMLWAMLPPVTAATVEGFVLEATAALGMLALLRTVGCGRTGSILGALSFGLAGFVAAHAVHPPILRSAVAVPWALVAIERLDGAALTAGLAASLGWILLGGHPQTIAYSLGLIVLYATWLGRPGERGRWRALLAALAIGIALGAPLWLPAARLIAVSTRSAFTPPFPNPRLTPSEWRWLVTPFTTGGLAGERDRRPTAGLACGPVECGGYPGVVVWLLVAAGLPPLLRDRRGRFWLTITALSLAGMTGLVPQPIGIRGPARIVLWWSVAMAAMAGIAFRALRDDPARLGRRVGNAATAVTGVMILAVSQGPGEWSAVAIGGLVLAMGALAVLAGSRASGTRRVAQAVLLVVLATEAAAYRSLVVTPAVTERAYREMREPIATAASVVRELRDHDVPHGRVLLIPPPLGSNWAAPMRVPVVQGYNLLVPRPSAEMLGQRMALGLESVGEIADPSLAADTSHVLDLLRVRLVLRDPQASNALGDAIARAAATGSLRWERLESARAGLEAYRNRRALPVAWLVERTIVATPEEALRRIRGTHATTAFDPATDALIPAPLAGDGGVPRTSIGATPDVAVVAYRDDELRFRIFAPAPTLLVTSELAHAGWHATVNDRPVPLLVADHAFRAVEVPAGPSDVTLRYAPRENVLGIGVGAVALASLVIVTAAAVRRRAPPRPARARDRSAPGRP